MADVGVVRFSYPAVVRLVQLAGLYWREIDGACAREGFDPLDLGITRFCHLILDWARQHTKEEDWDMVEGEIFAPFLDQRQPDWVPPQVVEEEMSLFSTFARQNETLGG